MGMADREKVMGVDLTGYRLSDESLKMPLPEPPKEEDDGTCRTE